MQRGIVRNALSVRPPSRRDGFDHRDGVHLAPFFLLRPPQGMIKATCLVLHHHICEGCAMSWPIHARFNIFNDPPGMEFSRRPPANGLAARQSGAMRMGRVGGESWGARGQQGRPPPSYAEVRDSTPVGRTRCCAPRHTVSGSLITFEESWRMLCLWL